MTSEAKHTPVTDAEAEFLHEQGWSSGFGWVNDLDWYRCPSYGPNIWITEDKKLMEQWLEDRAAYRVMRRTVLAQFHSLALLAALENIAHEASQYADGAEDAHYLAREMAKIEAEASVALAPFQKGDNK